MRLNSEHKISLGEIFVFGSNLAGKHGKGAAKTALDKHGAVYGQGQGWQGNSYAIPTKDTHLKTLSLQHIKLNVASFIEFTKLNIERKYFLTRIGCGLAGYKDSDIAPMFKETLKNVRKPPGW